MFKVLSREPSKQNPYCVSQVTVEETEAQEGEVTQVTQPGRERQSQGLEVRGRAAPPTRSGPGLAAHTESLPQLPSCLQSTRVPASKQSCLALCFQLPTHPLPAQLSHAFVSQLAKTPDGDRPASTPGPQSLVYPKATKKRGHCFQSTCKSPQTPQLMIWRQGPGRRLESEISPAEVRRGWGKGGQQERSDWHVCVCVRAHARM